MKNQQLENLYVPALVFGTWSACLGLYHYVTKIHPTRSDKLYSFVKPLKNSEIYKTENEQDLNDALDAILSYSKTSESQEMVAYYQVPKYFFPYLKSLLTMDKTNAEIVKKMLRITSNSLSEPISRNEFYKLGGVDVYVDLLLKDFKEIRKDVFRVLSKATRFISSKVEIAGEIPYGSHGGLALATITDEKKWEFILDLIKHVDGEESEHLIAFISYLTFLPSVIPKISANKEIATTLIAELLKARGNQVDLRKNIIAAISNILEYDFNGNVDILCNEISIHLILKSLDQVAIHYFIVKILATMLGGLLARGEDGLSQRDTIGRVLSANKYKQYTSAIFSLVTSRVIRKKTIVETLSNHIRQSFCFSAIYQKKLVSLMESEKKDALRRRKAEEDKKKMSEQDQMMQMMRMMGQ